MGPSHPKTRKYPFHNLSIEAWINLGLVAVLTFYVLQFGFDLFTHNVCRNIAVDYCAYWSAGEIANSQGYAGLYDVDLMKAVQSATFPPAAATPEIIGSVPYVYPPIFILPFQLLSNMDLQVGYWIWTLLNLVGFVLYLRFFVRQLIGDAPTNRLVLLSLASLPVFQCLFWGQINILLAIGVGEFVRNLMLKRPLVSGLWLGLSLIKPQVLILIIPLLLLRRSWKTLGGFALATAAIVGISFVMSGTTGVVNYWELLTSSAKGGAASNVDIMMNWRMLALHLSRFISPAVGWLVLSLGTLSCLVALVLLLRNKPDKSQTGNMLLMLVVFVTTLLITWHAHLSMSMILIPMLLVLAAQKILPMNLWLWWTFLPSGVLLVDDLLAAMIRMRMLPTSVAPFLDLAIGLSGLAINLALLAWALRSSRVIQTGLDKFPSSPVP